MTKVAKKASTSRKKLLLYSVLNTIYKLLPFSQIKRINLETENVIEDKNRKIIALEENLKTSQELFQHEISQLNTQLGERERRCQQVEEEFQRTRL